MPSPPEPIVRTSVRIPVNGGELRGDLVLPGEAQGVVIFAHGSGSSRHSPRNKFVARTLQESGIGTLLIDLLTEREDIDYQARFDIPLLTERLRLTTDWLQSQPSFHTLAVGYFGASTGAAAAIRAAASIDTSIAALVSRGGRVDLAREASDHLTVPTLLIVGENDFGVLEDNEEIFTRLRGDKRLNIIPGATHLFEEPGTLEQVAALATEWFLAYLPSPAPPSPH